MTNIATIYVSLLNEGVDVRRPVLAEQLGAGIYRIADQEYDREIETWEFPPGAEVVCQLVASSGGEVLAAISRR